jgi:hypothetical protein
VGGGVAQQPDLLLDREPDRLRRRRAAGREVVRLTGLLHYDIGSDGRFSRIRVGRFGAVTKNEAASLE